MSWESNVASVSGQAQGMLASAKHWLRSESALASSANYVLDQGNSWQNSAQTMASLGVQWVQNNPSHVAQIFTPVAVVPACSGAQYVMDFSGIGNAGRWSSGGTQMVLNFGGMSSAVKWVNRGAQGASGILSVLPLAEVVTKYQFGTAEFTQQWSLKSLGIVGGIVGPWYAGGTATALLATAGAGATVAATAGPILAAIAVGAALTGLGALVNNTSKQLGQHLTSPQVGGVLFDHCDAVLTDVAEITGAYWDSETNSLVLIGRGRSGAGLESMGLPSMDEDLVRLALRASVAGMPLGVSIDPPAEFRYGKRRRELPPPGTPLLVSYLGDSAGSLGGAILFESDRIMKCLSIGMDNKTGQPFGARVEGYSSTLDASAQGGLRGAQAWHRFWFVIDRVELKRDPASGGLAFGEARIKVMCEQEPDESGQPGSLDQVDARFAAHLTEFYEQYAAEYPVLARLKELAKITAVCKLIAGRGVPLAAGPLFHAAPTPVATPATTPSVTRTITLSGGSGTQSHSMCGGVDLAVRPTVKDDAGGEVAALRRAAAGARAGRVNDWTFSHGGAVWRAKAVELVEPACPWRRMVMDHRFAAQGSGAQGAPIFLQRVYDSARLRSGDFGPGWHLHLPFELRVVRNTGKHPEVRSPEEEARHTDEPSLLVLRESATGETGLYRPVGRDAAKPDVQAFCLVTGQDLAGEGVRFHYDSARQIVRHGSRFHLTREGVTCEFNPEGQLETMAEAGRILVRWVWRGSRLARIEDAQGLGYECHYEEAGGERITRITVSDGEALRYHYGEDGLLRECAAGLVPRECYAYDLAGRLVETRNAAGAVLDRAVYDAAQNLMGANREETVPLAGGGWLRRRVAQGRMEAIEDDHGTRAECAYGPHGNLASVVVTNRAGVAWGFHYEGRGRLQRVVLPGGRAVALRLDRSGQADRVTGADGRTVSLERDEQRCLVGMSDSAGGAWRVGDDASKGTVQFQNGSGERIEMKMDARSGRLKRFRNGKTKFDDFGGVTLSRQPTPDGGWLESIVEPRRARTRVIEPGGRRTTEVDRDGKSVITRSRAGAIRVGVGETPDEVVVTFLG